MVDSRVRKTKFGFYVETVMKVYEGEEAKARKLEFAKDLYEMSLNFASDEISVIALTERFVAAKIESLINRDYLYVGLVVLTCLLYMTIHTGSLFLSTTSLLNVFMSIPICLVLYKSVFQVNYFSSSSIDGR